MSTSNILPVAVPTQDAVVTDFRGAWLRPDASDVPASEALLSLNCEYNPGEVMSRNGFGLLWNPNAILTSLFNWVKEPDLVSASGNYLVAYNKTAGEVQYAPNLTTPVLNNLFAVTAEAVAPASGGNQLFLPTFTAAGTGAAQMRIAVLLAGLINVDKAFQGPITAKPVLTNITDPIAPDTVTAGSHFIGYIMTDESGFTGPINPVLVGTNTPDQTSSITAPGGQQVGIVLTTTFPAQVTGIQFVATAVTNPFQYFVIPGQSYGVTGGVLQTITAEFAISDQILIADATDVTNNQFFLTQDSSGNGPFSPFFAILYGQRWVYLTLNAENLPVFYASEPDNPQQLTQQFNERFLPGFQQIVSGFVLRGILYILGPHWTYAFEDTGGEPVTWPSAALVDGRIGTQSILGTVVNSSGDWAAVVHVTGLYIFNGQYADNPITFMVDSDWRRINWAAAQTIRIDNNKDEKELVVVVPFNTNSTVNIVGTAVTLVSGDYFAAGWSAVVVSVNGTIYNFTTTSPTTGTLSASATATNATMTCASPIPTHMMMFDYADVSPGAPPDYTSIRYSLWYFKTPFSPRGFCVCQNNTTNRMEFLVADGAAGPVLRQMNPEDDGANWPYDYQSGGNGGIDFQWECAPQPDGSIGWVMAHVGAYVRIRGSGVPLVTSYGVDRTISKTWTKPMVLSTAPGQDYWRQFYLTSERCSTRFVSGINPGDYAILAGYRHRFYQWALRR